jgi:hypothetical protein
MLAFGLVSCTSETTGPISEITNPVDNNDLVLFTPKVHESMLLVNYKVEVDGIAEHAIFKRGTSPHQTIRLKGEPVVQENGRIRVVIHTRSANQSKWFRLTTLQIAPGNSREIVLHDGMKVIYDKK